MWEKELKEFEAMSRKVGELPQYVQGGGGNTSVKLDDERMAVKASGCKLKHMTSSEGYVVINYKNIRSYYENVNLQSNTDFEKESVEVAKKNIVPMEGLKALRPSVEAGFHSILKKYVIHTHPVYTNILCCSVEGRSHLDRIFEGSGFSYVWIPYLNPGFCLTLKIAEEIRRYTAETGVFPEVIFMEKHGLIVTSEDYERVLYLHSEVNHRIRSWLGMGEEFPDICLEKLDEEVFQSRTSYLRQFFINRKIGEHFLDEMVLYPDQLVYLNGSVSINGVDNKLTINTSKGELLYKTAEAEARTIEETLLAYLFVLDGIKQAGMRVNPMTQKEIDFIKNWESEAYRKSLLKELVK